jgi:hypothetical protein
MSVSESVINMERELMSLRAEVQRLKNLIHAHKLEEGLIPKKIQCCSRDYDRDGNCDIHSAPGVLRNKAMQPEENQ